MKSTPMLVGILAITTLTVSQVKTWKHLVYNNTREEMSVMPIGVANPNNTAVTIAPDGQGHEIDMCGYLTSGFEITGIDDNKKANSNEHTITFDNPFKPDIAPGVTINLSKDCNDFQSTTHETPYGIKAIVTSHNGKSQTFYSPKKGCKKVKGCR